VIIRNVFESIDYTTDYVVFTPEQIKSATGNEGTFSGGMGNIYFQETESLNNADNNGMSAVIILKENELISPIRQ
jgi:hypothetical protein